MEQPSRGRYRFLKTDPRENPEPKPTSWVKKDVITNFIELRPRTGEVIYTYRVDFEPDIEAKSERTRMFHESLKEQHFKGIVIFDGLYDARSPVQLSKLEVIAPRRGSGEQVKIIVKPNGTLDWASMEMLRLYNMQMRKFLEFMKFYSVRSGARSVFVDPATEKPVGDEKSQHKLSIVRGYETAANIHDGKRVLMNMESVHKIVQKNSVYDIMNQIRQFYNNDMSRAGPKIQIELTNKLVVAQYQTSARKQTNCYRIQNVDFSKKPSTYKFDYKGTQITICEYYQKELGQTLIPNQPLLLVTHANESRKSRELQLAQQKDGQAKNLDIYVPPQLFAIAGLTSPQINDTYLKMDLIRATQLSPKERVESLKNFLGRLRNNASVKETLDKWRFDFNPNPLKIQAKIAPEDHVFVGNRGKKIIKHDASFDTQNCKLASPAHCKKLVIICPSREQGNFEAKVQQRLRSAFEEVGLSIGAVDRSFIRGDRPRDYEEEFKKKLPCDIAMFVMSKPNKETYDLIKKSGTIYSGIPTQVVTMNLLNGKNDRKAQSACPKIAVQMAAKLGGEPWHVDIPTKTLMVCGYDTYHDTTNRGRSFGAFVASSNKTFSRWWSKVDVHEVLGELSVHLATNLCEATKNWAKQNDGNMPDRIFVYRDGVGDGDLEAVFNFELKEARNRLHQLPNAEKTKLTFIVVNKRINAKFIAEDRGNYVNPKTGTIIESGVTREGRFDFYLISASTTQGTISPTYYNVLLNESGWDDEKVQLFTYKMTFNYYNWTGAVKVPAPCQYAHKLAFQAGEHLHDVPNSNLSNLLHFL